MTFQDDINRMLAEGLRDANERLRHDTPDLLVDPSLIFMNSGAPVDPPKPSLTVKRHSAYIQMSTEQALDAGLITEEQARAQGWTPYVPPPIPWRSRIRWRWQSWRERAGRKVGGWIAGVDLTEGDDW